MSDLFPLRIAVVGAGPAGLTFASVLHRKATDLVRDGQVVPWEVTLYEAERSPNTRRIGGSLDLGRQTGLKALTAAGLFNRFHDFARPEGQEIRLVNHHGDTIFHYAGDATPDDDRYNPEIDRADLNRILVESLPQEVIQWDHKVRSVHQLENGLYQVTFANNSTICADVIVGADGAWSHVRPLVTDENPEYPATKATFLDIAIHDFKARYPDLDCIVGNGTLYSFGGGHMLVAQRNTRNVVHVYLGIHAPPDWRQHKLLQDISSDRDRVLTLVNGCFGDWGEPLRALAIVAAENVDNTTLISWPLYAMPVGVCWSHRRGATLIGDAAHLMSPCAGEGVNTAMVDAMELALALAQAVETGSEAFQAAAMDAVEAFEREMLKRAEDPARRSSDNLNLFFSVPEMTMEHVTQMFGPLCSTTPPGMA